MRYFIRRYMYLIPPMFLVFDLLSSITTINFTIWGNIIGYSLFSNIIFLWVFWFSGRKYCWFTKLCIPALFITNIVNVFGEITGNHITYSVWYHIIIIAIITILTVFAAIKNL